MQLNEKVYKLLCEVMPGGVNSPVRSFKGLKNNPIVVEKGAGDTITDVEGKTYIDYCCSWGPLIHVHAHPEILKTAYEKMQNGTSFGISTPVEEQIARKIVNSVDSIDQIRFVSSGTEATMSAVRLARGFTGRDLVVKFTGNYHGHADFFLVQAGSGVTNLSPTSSSAGIPDALVKHMICLPYNDHVACKNLFNDPCYRSHIAAVILEPIAGNMGVVPAHASFIEMLREETEKIGALLIFDEVITGFRVGLGGAQALYHVKPDMTCFGKIVGGGFPAGAFGGRKEVMDCLAPTGPVYQAGTLSGNPVAMAAGLKTIELLCKEGVYKELERKTKVITEPVQQFLKEKNIPACIQQVGSMFTLFFGKEKVENMDDARALDLVQFGQFFNYMLENGVYIPPSQHEAWFISTVHEEAHLEQTRDLILKFFQI